MSIHVIKDDKGNVIATVRVDSARRGLFGPDTRTRALRVHHVELPPELDGLVDPRRLRARLKKLVP